MRTRVCSAYDAAGFNGANVVGFMPYGSSKYHGLQTQCREASQRPAVPGRLDLEPRLDDSTADVFSTVLTPRRPQDFQCFTCDRGDSALDRRHRITLQATYDLPFLKNDNWFDEERGWQLADHAGLHIQSPEYATVPERRRRQPERRSRLTDFIKPCRCSGDRFDSTALTNCGGDSGVRGRQSECPVRHGWEVHAA